MYIKIRKWGSTLWEYCIYSANNARICSSTSSWGTVGGVVRAAVKLATDLGIEYKETKL